MPGVRGAGAFPAVSLPELSGRERSIAQAWGSGRALVLIGHASCATTRQTLPYVDRIHRRRGRGHGVVAVLQDAEEAAAELKRDLKLELPLLLERDPYPLARALGLVTVPTLFLVGPDGAIARFSEAWSRAALEGFAEDLGVAGPLLDPDDPMPALKPG